MNNFSQVYLFNVLRRIVIRQYRQFVVGFAYRKFVQDRYCRMACSGNVCGCRYFDPIGKQIEMLLSTVSKANLLKAPCDLDETNRMLSSLNQGK